MVALQRLCDFVETLQDLEDNGRVSAVVVRINSPGGAVAPSQEMYDAVRRLAAKNECAMTKPAEAICASSSRTASCRVFSASTNSSTVASCGN